MNYEHKLLAIQNREERYWKSWCKKDRELEASRIEKIPIQDRTLREIRWSVVKKREGLHPFFDAIFGKHVILSFLDKQIAIYGPNAIAPIELSSNAGLFENSEMTCPKLFYSTWKTVKQSKYEFFDKEEMRCTLREIVGYINPITKEIYFFVDDWTIVRFDNSKRNLRLVTEKIWEITDPNSSCYIKTQKFIFENLSLSEFLYFFIEYSDFPKEIYAFRINGKDVRNGIDNINDLEHFDMRLDIMMFMNDHEENWH